MENGIYIVKTYGRKTKYFYHWGLLCVKSNGDYIYHNSEYNEKNSNGGSIKKESWEEFTNKYKPINFIKTNLSESELIKKVTPLLSKPYQKILFNCNTFLKEVAPQFTPLAQEKYFYFLGFTLIIGFAIYKYNGKK